MNRVILSGNLTRDIELTEKDSLLIGKFALGVTRSQKNKNGEYETDFFNCVSFNPSEYVQNNLLKGTKVLVEGRLQNHSYTDEKGNKRVLTDVIVERVEVSRKSENTQEKAKETTNNPFEEFGQQFELGEQTEIDLEGDLPW